MSDKLKKLFSQRGATTILIAFFVMNVFLMMALTAASIMIYQIQMSKEAANSVSAFYAADAGAERCLYQTRCVERNPATAECIAETGTGLNGGCASVGNSINFSLSNGATISATRVEASKIQAKGSFGLTQRQVELFW